MTVRMTSTQYHCGGALEVSLVPTRRYERQVTDLQRLVVINLFDSLFSASSLPSILISSMHMGYATTKAWRRYLDKIPG